MVEWKKLGEIAHITIGEFVHKDKQSPNAAYPVYNGGISYTGFYDDFNNTENKIVISARGATAGFVNRVFCKYWAGNSSYSIDVKPLFASWTFIFYYLKNFQYKLISDQQKGGGIPSISKKQVQDIQIPLPSLSEQERIVGILDTFTSSIENLKAQISLRRKQYEHYRDKLLNLEGKPGVEMKTLKDVAIIKNGKDYKGLQEGNFPVYGTGGIMTYVNEFASDKPSVLLPRKGSIENIFYVDVPFWTVDTIYWTEIDTTKVVPKYLYSSLLRYNLKDYAYGGARPSLSQPILYKLQIPLPSLEEQSRIVSILDEFEASIKNLEAQLEAREKQYEYYRNKLLSF